VGRQVTLSAPSVPALLTILISEAQAGRIDLVVRSRIAGASRGWAFDRLTASMRSDRDSEPLQSPATLRGLAAVGSEQVWTAVPKGLGLRLGRDRDGDGFGDRTELDAGSDPANPLDVP
jgi:hypothetical protein